MRSETSFELDGDLITIEATIAGPNGHSVLLLVLDTGASLTTLSSEIAEALGYTPAMRLARSVVSSAVADEHGYIVALSRVTALGVTLFDVNANIADLSHGFDGLLGMSFLSELNFEIRPAERRILVEKITP
jgi:clan AA aspartic protease (TIGR02281 family)